MKRWYFQLAAFLISGLILGAVTFGFVEDLGDLGHSEALRALSISGVGIIVGFWAAFIHIILLSFDAVWTLLFIVWLIKKMLHIRSGDNAIYLP